MIKVLKIITFSFVGLIVVLLILGVTLPIIYKKEIKSKIVESIDANLKANFHFDEVEISFINHFPFASITLTNFGVIGIDEFQKDTLIKAERFKLVVDIQSFWREVIDFESIYLQKANIHLKILKNGKANYDIIQTSQDSKNKTSAGSNLKIDKWVLQNSVFRYQDELNAINLQMQGVNYRSHADFNKQIFDIYTQTEAKFCTFAYQNTQYIHQKYINLTATLEANLKENKFTFKHNLFKINHFQFNADGFLKVLKNGDLNTDLKFAIQDTDFKDILSLIPGVYLDDLKKVKTKGHLSCEAELKGDYTTQKIPNFKVKFHIKDGSLQYEGLPNSIDSIFCDLNISNKTGDWRKTHINLKKIKLQVDHYPVEGYFKMHNLVNPIFDTDLKVQMDLSEIQRIYPINHLNLRGMANWKLKAKGEWNWGKKIIPKFFAQAEVKDAYFKYNTLPQAFEKVHFKMQAENKSGILDSTWLDIERIYADMGKNDLKGYFKMKGFERYYIDSDLFLDLDLADVEKMYPMESLIAKGVCVLDLKIKGNYDQAQKKMPTIDSKISLRNGYFKSKTFPKAMEEVHFVSEISNTTGHLVDTRIHIDTLTYMMDEQPFVLDGNLHNLDNYHYDFKVKGKLDFDKITQIFPITGLKLSGSLSTDIETKGKYSDIENQNYENLETTGKLIINNLRISGNSFPQAVLIKSGELDIATDKLTLENTEVIIGQSDFKIKGHLYNYKHYLFTGEGILKGDIDLKCNYLNLDEWMNDAWTKNADNKSSNSTIMSIIKIPQDLDFVLDSEIDLAKFDKLDIKNLKGEITIRNGTLFLKETGFNSANGLIKLSGHYHTLNPENPYFDFDLDIDDLDIAQAYNASALIQTLAPAAQNIFGLVSTKYKISGVLDKTMMPIYEKISGTGYFSISKAKINGMKVFNHIHGISKRQELKDPHLKDLKMDVDIQKGALTIKPFVMKISGFDTEISGTSQFSGELNYLIKIALPPLHIKVPFHVEGTMDNYKVRLGKGHTIVAENQ